MKYQVIVSFLLGLTSSIANAQGFQSRKPVVCDETKRVIQALTENYDEKPLWTAKDQDDGTRYSLFVNKKNGTWTILQMNPEYACILGVGEESEFIFDTAI